PGSPSAAISAANTAAWASSPGVRANRRRTCAIAPARAASLPTLSNRTSIRTIIAGAHRLPEAGGVKRRCCSTRLTGLAAPGFDTAVAWLTVNSSRVSSPLAIPGAIVAGAAALALTLSACGSDSDSTSATTTSDTTTSTMTTSPTGTAVAQSCPTAAPGEDVAPDWTFTGDTGSIAVTGPTDEAAPLVTVEGPFSVSETRVEVLQDGDGDRKSTRLNSSHVKISYAVFCLKKKIA